ncbi:DUF4352 domain-containing protein [Streptomyces lusitanus]|uniref:DUF4352 domain-containing protein n=1 Tax=Streptomyces lusitanus TaxID=68232 RepID=A0ABU3JP86_9ACTN|nr:DUF4352 domain-containing protein [Streptomyces lusitanus]
MRYTITLPAALLLLAGAAVGCSSDSDGKPTVSKATSTPTAAATSASPSPTPSRETYKIGDTLDIETSGYQFAVTVIAFKDKGITTDVPGLLQDGEKWAQVEVKVCNAGSEAFSVSPAPWSLAYEDGVRVDATSISGAELPAPEYPVEARVRGGDCVRGNVPFEVPKEGRPERVLYAPGDLDEPVEWQLPRG